VDQALLDLTAEVVSGYVSNNRTASDQLPTLIRTVYQTFANAGPTAAAELAKVEPVIPAKRSVLADRILCLVCGQGFRMLKRHLSTEHDLTPVEYRARYELPRSYPMVAPDYAKVRSKLAKKIGLGRGSHPRVPSRMAGKRGRS
jgi:predicted transcriptional regulator